MWSVWNSWISLPKHVCEVTLRHFIHNMLATSEAMKKQMVAERTRRGDFIRSEGKKAAVRLRAEGEKVVSINTGIAEQVYLNKYSHLTHY